MNTFKITPRNLGSLELPSLCLACFWYLCKLYFRPPFNSFGAALFNDCQKMQEAMIGYYLEKDGCLPTAFAPFCDIKRRCNVNKHWNKFGYTHESGVWLYGSPDEVFERADGSILILDHKTAHPKAADAPDPFKPQYEVQTIGYGMIAELGLDLGKVSAGALAYWDLQHKQVMEDPKKFIRDGQLWATFVPKVVPVEIDYARVNKLLAEAVKIWKSSTPPEGNDGCRECGKREALFIIQSAVENELSVRDQKLLQAAVNDIRMHRRVVQRAFDRRQSRNAALCAIEQIEDADRLGELGMSADWEFLDCESSRD